MKSSTRACGGDISGMIFAKAFVIVGEYIQWSVLICIYIEVFFY